MTVLDSRGPSHVGMYWIFFDWVGVGGEKYVVSCIASKAIADKAFGYAFNTLGMMVDEVMRCVITASYKKMEEVNSIFDSRQKEVLVWHFA